MLHSILGWLRIRDGYRPQALTHYEYEWDLVPYQLQMDWLQRRDDVAAHILRRMSKGTPESLL